MIPKIIPIHDVKRAHKGDWFDKNTGNLIFSVAKTALLQKGKAYFVGSEREDLQHPCFFFICVCDMATGDISTIERFEGFGSKRDITYAIMQKALDGKLHIVIETDGDKFHAYCPSLKGLHTCGDTEEKARSNAQDAIISYLRSMEKHGDFHLV